MKASARIAGCISGCGFLVALVSFVVWTQHLELYSTSWDALLPFTFVAALVGVVAGALGIALWLSR